MFVEESGFPFIIDLKSEWQSIRDEFLALPALSFDPWVQTQMHGEGWSVFALHALGEPIAGACAQCPRTAAALSQIPGLSLAGFSRLGPGAEIKPHVGWAKSVYRLHLGLVVPDDCILKVSDEERAWREGEVLIFDDTAEHSAWNHSSKPRTTLMLDFLRPGCNDFSSDPVPVEVRAYVEYLKKR
jgi:aspartyl/asparaginyl beta-hydroxylase (cupin superfamily)